MPKQAAQGSSVERYRERMRQAGFRLVQFWVPDTKAPGFAEECRRQSLLVAEDPAEREAMDALMALQDTSGWEA